MARTIPRASSDHPSPSASNATSSGRVTKSRSEQSTSRSAPMTRQRSSMLGAASSSGVLQSMVDEAQDVVAGSSSRAKGKSRAVNQDAEQGMDFQSEPTYYSNVPAYIEEHPDSMEDVHQDDEDVDMQQALLESMPANEVCPIIDKDQKPFRLMDLPAEIRLEIYRACLTRPYDILLSKREKPRRQEPETDSDKSGLLLSDSPSDADEPESDHQTVFAGTLTQAARLGSSPARRSSLAHGVRNAASRSARPIRLLSSRSAPGPSTNQNSNDNTLSAAAQAGASRPATRSSRFRQASTRNRGTAHRVRTVSVPANEPPRNQTQDPLLVNILRVSKEVYKEARSVLYNENKFNLDLNTAMSTLSLLHQRSRRQIKHVELEIPTYNEILERFQETVRLSLRYCTGLKTFVIHMPFTLPGADGSGTTGNTTVYANGFDILRWLPQECNIVMKGNICTEIEVVVNKHLHLAKTLDKVSHQRMQIKPWMQGPVENYKQVQVQEEADKENIAPSASTN